MKLEKIGVLKYFGESNNPKVFIQDCKVFVYPSIYREGVPRVVLEAMSIGRYIITTNLPGCRETVKNNYNGVLLDEISVQNLVEKIEWTIYNEDKLELMGKRSREIAENKFNVHDVNQKLLKLIELT
jgi:glycosyltransferase involved in cell wall biosynthesis